MYSIKDYGVFDNSKLRDIQIKALLASPSKKTACDYANKYIHLDSSELNPSHSNTEGKIFQRVLGDNDIPASDLPPAMLQPVLLGFNAEALHGSNHKMFGGVHYGARPTKSTLVHIASLTGIPFEDFVQRYPILAQRFEQ